MLEVRPKSMGGTLTSVNNARRRDIDMLLFLSIFRLQSFRHPGAAIPYPILPQLATNKKTVQKDRTFLAGGTACFRQRDAILRPEGTELHVSFDRERL